jgi:hypothetical protein
LADEDRSRVQDILASRGTIQAIIELRRLLGVSIPDADFLVDELRREAGTSGNKDEVG